MTDPRAGTNRISNQLNIPHSAMKTALPPTTAAAALLACLSLGLGGCAATQVTLEHKDLNVQTQMSNTVFLELDHPVQRTVYLEVKNTSDRELAVEPLIRSRLAQAGYQVLPDPQSAFYILQVNVLQVGAASPSALTDSINGGWGSPLGGGLAGAAIGRASSSPHGDLKGAVIGSAVEMIAGSLVKNVTFSIVTDVQITERSNDSVAQKVQSNFQQGTGTQVAQTSEGVTNRKKYQTRVVSLANKVNLKFEQALPALEQQLARSIAGIL